MSSTQPHQPPRQAQDRHHDQGHSQQDGQHHDMSSGLNAMAASATLHCLTGCAIGEILGLLLGTAWGLSNAGTVVLAIALAFVFGYSLSTLPLLRAGLGLFAALSVVLAADTLSIATMELVDNVVMGLIPGAMEAGLADVVFWIGMLIALTAAFAAAYPVNRYLLQRGKGHALTHEYHSAAAPTGWRRHVPAFSTGALAAAIIAFLLGGLTVAAADGLSTAATGPGPDVEHGLGVESAGS